MVGQVSGSYEAREESMVRYLGKVRDLILAFDSSLPVPENQPRSGQPGPDQGDGPHADEQSENKDENNNHEETRYIDVQ